MQLTTAIGHVLDVIKALEAAQKAGIVHSDVHPGNCVVTNAKTVLVDWELASKEGTESYRFTGSPFFRSTKSLQATIDGIAVVSSHADDLESVAYLLLHLIRGQLPWIGARNFREVIDGREFAGRPSCYKAVLDLNDKSFTAATECLITFL